MLLLISIFLFSKISAGYFDVECSRTHAKLTLNSDKFKDVNNDPSFDKDLVGLYLWNEKMMPQDKGDQFFLLIVFCLKFYLLD